MKRECPQLHDTQAQYCIALTQYQLIEISGIDAEKYLQGQLTCDVQKLAIGEHSLTAHCDPKGKMSALFRLVRQDDTTFLMIIRRNLLPEALMLLKKYAVFSKVTFTELNTFIYGIASGMISEEFCKNTTILSISDEPQRNIVLSETPLVSNASFEWWDLMDMQKGIPILMPENRLEMIPQSVNLQLIERAISFSKGCYIGQETIARAKYRGINKRAMFTLWGEIGNQTISLPEIGSAIEIQIETNWKKTGTILATVVYQEKIWIQIVLNKEIEKTSVFRLLNHPNIQLQCHRLPYELE